MSLVIVDAKALGDDPFEIDSSPSDHAVNFPVRASFDDGREFGLLIWRQTRSWSTRPIVQQPVGASFIEAMNPIAQGLTVHATDPGCIRAVHPVQNRRQRQQPPTLIVFL